MKNFLFIITILLFSITLSAQEFNDTTTVFQPEYMKYKLTSNYYINQPIKESFRYAGALNGLIPMGLNVYLFTQNEEGFVDRDYGTNLILPVASAIVGSAIGLPVGLYKGYKKKNQEGRVVFEKPIIANEMKGSNSHGKLTFSYSLHIDKKVLFFEKIIFNTVASDWLHAYSENKMYLGVSDVYDWSEYISSYYNLQFGVSTITSNVDFQNKKFYPTALAQIGLKLDLIDFLYFKLEFERDFSGAYEEHKKDIPEDEYFDMTSKANDSFGFVIGTYLF